MDAEDEKKDNKMARAGICFFPPHELKLMHFLFPSRLFQSLPIPMSGQIPLHGLSAIHQVLALVVAPVCLLKARWWKGVLVTPPWILRLGAFEGLWQCGLLRGLVSDEAQQQVSKFWSTPTGCGKLSSHSWIEPCPHALGG